MSEQTATATKDPTSTIYDFSVTAQDGSTVSLDDYRGKVLLVVNTATGCGFTPQYTGLEALYRKYRDRGFEILDFPCNQFAGQAPGTNEEIHEFCVGRFAMTFPQFHEIPDRPGRQCGGPVRTEHHARGDRRQHRREAVVIVTLVTYHGHDRGSSMQTMDNRWMIERGPVG